MNKLELIEALASKTGLTKSDIEKTINAFVATTVSQVKKGEKVAIAGLGHFELTKRAAKVGINPITKAKIQIKAKNAPKFKAAKAFKEAVAK